MMSIRGSQENAGAQLEQVKAKVTQSGNLTSGDISARDDEGHPTDL